MLKESNGKERKEKKRKKKGNSAPPRVVDLNQDSPLNAQVERFVPAMV